MKSRIKRTAPSLTVNSLGPIRSATMEFSDLTVLVGPQATGKSILVQLLKLLVDTAHIKYESMFFIPAQRVLAMRDGWPQAFGYYDPGVPFTVREFSEELRLLMADFGTEGTLFPVPRRLKDEFRELLQRHVFPGFNLKVDTQRAQKRLPVRTALRARRRMNATAMRIASAPKRRRRAAGSVPPDGVEEHHPQASERCEA